MKCGVGAFAGGAGAGAATYASNYFSLGEISKADLKRLLLNHYS
jgi:hypothetical protein